METTRGTPKRRAASCAEETVGQHPVGVQHIGPRPAAQRNTAACPGQEKPGASR